MLAGSSVNGIASDVRLTHYIYIVAEQGFWGVVGAGGERGDIPLWFFK